MSEAGRLQNHHDRTVESIGIRGARITCLMAEPENTRQSCRDGVCWSWMDGDWSWRERRRERAGCGVCGLVGVRDTTPEPHPAPTGTTRRGLTSYSAGLGEMQGGHRPRPKRKRFDKTPTAWRGVWGGCGPFFGALYTYPPLRPAPSSEAALSSSLRHSNPGLRGLSAHATRNGRGRRGVALAVSCAVEDANNNKRACKRLLPGLVTDRLWSR